MDSGTKVYVFFHFDSRKHDIIIFMKADGNCRITMDYRRNLFGGPRFYVVTESAVKIRKNNRVSAVFLGVKIYIKNERVKFASFPGGEFEGGGTASPFAYLRVSVAQPQKKN